MQHDSEPWAQIALRPETLLLRAECTTVNGSALWHFQASGADSVATRAARHCHVSSSIHAASLPWRMTEVRVAVNS
jgi:hypothetical protein